MKKIPTIFLRDHENRGKLTSSPNPECDWVFADEGRPTMKLDGTCCLVEDGKLFKRREVKAHKQAPREFILSQVDRNTHKQVGWVPIGDGPDDKYHREAFGNGAFSDGTYELCGPKVQGNPEGLFEHHLINHETLELLVEVPRDYEGLREWLLEQDVEGVVWHHEDGRMAKIKKKDFGYKREV